MSDFDPFLDEMREACWTELDAFLKALESAIPDLCDAAEDPIDSLAARCLELESHLCSIQKQELADVLRHCGRFVTSLRFHRLHDRDKLRLQAHLLCLIETFRVALGSLRQGGAAASGEIAALLSSWKPESGDGPESESPVVSRSPHLICRRGETLVAIPVREILEILEGRRLAALPLPHSKVKGLLNLRGEALPVLRLAPEISGRFTLVSQCGSRRFAIEVDEVFEVAVLDSGSFQESAGRTLVNVADRPVLVLELSKVIAA